jgi:CHAT domain-containing protein
VADLYGGDSIVGSLATKPAFLDGLRRHDVIHFAGHAVVSSSRTGASSLVLAPSEADSGLLSPDEIGVVSLVPGALVVLAGCDTADGATFRGEGLMGLVRPFIAAGGASVVANLWPVDDESTVEFMRAFHLEVRDGVAPALALQRIQRSFASRKLPARTWAGWIAVGGYQ